jgi:hypothetical protein
MARPRFTLRSVFLTVTVFAFVLTVWTSAKQFRENRRLRAENRLLRNEVGTLTIEAGDEDKFHAIEIPSFDERTWRWRVYVPPGKRSYLRAMIGKIPLYGFPKAKMHQELLLSSGEQVVTVALGQTEVRGWNWHLETEYSTNDIGSARNASWTIDKVSADWIKKDHGVLESQGVLQDTSNGPSNDPFLLTRAQLIPNSSAQLPAEHADGIIIWIDD